VTLLFLHKDNTAPPFVANFYAIHREGLRRPDARQPGEQVRCSAWALPGLQAPKMRALYAYCHHQRLQ